MDGATRTVDYVIVGAGTAGCVLASRLSADAGTRVLVLEAGADDRSIRLRIPLVAQSLWFDPRFNWGYVSEPEPECQGRTIAIPRGKLLGGSSAINGMLHMRGHPSDYEAWERLGAAGWGPSDVLPAFRRSESHWLGDTPHHGGSGPLSVSRNRDATALAEPFLAAADAAGFSRSEDQNGAQPEGFGPPDMAIDARGRRASAFTAYLKPALRRANLDVATGAQVTRVVFERHRATAVDYIRDGAPHTVRAEREIILAGGAINSPQLLLLSGVGPADELRALGIAPIHDLPGVGRNLQDHPAAGMEIACVQPVAFDAQLRYDRLAASLLLWGLLGTGPATGMPVVCNGFVRTRAELERPDIQFMVMSASPLARPWFPGIRKPAGHVIATRHVLLHPEGRGAVRLASGDPLAKPRVLFNLLSTRRDVETLSRSFELMRDILSRAPLAALCGREILPGPGARIDDYLRATVRTTLHPVGTCAMGCGPDAVVDSVLKVRGVDGLRVIDASVMPTITGGNTNAPVLMIAERGADFILGAPACPEDRVTTRQPAAMAAG